MAFALALLARATLGAGVLAAAGFDAMPSREPRSQERNEGKKPFEAYLRTMSNVSSSDIASGMENTVFFNRFALGSMA